jgi:hypothetical protein
MHSPALSHLVPLAFLGTLGVIQPHQIACKAFAQRKFVTSAHCYVIVLLAPGSPAYQNR